MSTEAAILAMLDSSPSLTYVPRGGTSVPRAVYDGQVEVDETEKVIAVPLPYLIFWSSPGYDRDERQSGQVGGRVKEFRLTGVGETREQAQWILDRAREALSRKRLGRSLIRRGDSNAEIRRADDYTRPGGGPLFYGADEYAVAT